MPFLTTLGQLWAAINASGELTVFLVFLAPFGPGAPAGIVLARSHGLSAGTTIWLYVLGDVLTAVVLEPLIRLLRSRGERSPVGQRVLRAFERLGSVTQVSAGRLGLPLGLYVFTFATDFYSAGVISTGLALSRVVAWICIIAGDVTWFLIIFLASIGIASFLSDDRILFIATLVIGFALPPLVRRLMSHGQPALPREPDPGRR